MAEIKIQITSSDLPNYLLKGTILNADLKHRFCIHADTKESILSETKEQIEYFLEGCRYSNINPPKSLRTDFYLTIFNND